VYAGPLKGGSRAVILFNRHSPDYRCAVFLVGCSARWLASQLASMRDNRSEHAMAPH